MRVTTVAKNAKWTLVRIYAHREDAIAYASKCKKVGWQTRIASGPSGTELYVNTRARHWSYAEAYNLEMVK